ncbi:MAG: hypothetical protein K0Q47_25 [Sedimentibacter sp.]|jgi:hypothetical protein|nr:hypothetical protein [Sedimentibacter sp.]
MDNMQLMAINWITKEKICGSPQTVTDVFKNWQTRHEDNEAELKKLNIRAYNKTLWEVWNEFPNEGETMHLMSCLQKDRKIDICNSEEYQQVTEFLYLHNSGFAVLNIDSDADTCIIELL